MVIHIGFKKFDFLFPLPFEQGGCDYEIVNKVPWNDFLKNKIAATEKELVEET